MFFLKQRMNKILQKRIYGILRGNVLWKWRWNDKNISTINTIFLSSSCLNTLNVWLCLVFDSGGGVYGAIILLYVTLKAPDPNRSKVAMTPVQFEDEWPLKNSKFHKQPKLCLFICVTQ